jgi:hypothetical protein
MRMATLLLVIGSSVLPYSAAGQSTPATPDVLAQVRIPVAVRAGGEVLSSGTYEVRLARDAAAPGTGVTAAQHAVEFVNAGVVVARDVAEILRDDDLPPVGASTRPAAQGVRVDLLKGGEFLRVSVKREGTRYLIHLPMVP